MELDDSPIPCHPRLAAELKRIGIEFSADFFAGVVERYPQNLDALGELALNLTQLGRYEEGLDVDERLVRAMPEDPLVRYNLACSLCLNGSGLEALDALEAAAELGYDDAAHMLLDEDLKVLRKEQRFQRLAHRIANQAR